MSVDEVLLFAELHEVPESETDTSTNGCSQYDLVCNRMLASLPRVKESQKRTEPQNQEPVFDGASNIRVVYDEIQGEEKEREGGSVVATTLSC